MSTIASLNIAMNVGTAEVREGFAEVAESGEMLEGVMESLESTLALVGIGLGVAEFKEWIGGSMEAIDQTAKLADRMGVTTESLTGMRHAAALAGVGAQEFDASLSKLEKNLGEAAVKGGPAKEALDSLGLSAKDLTGIPVDQAMRRIADRMEGIENPALRSHIAVDLLGRTGQNLINVLSEGSKAFDEAQAKVEKYGVAVSRVDAAKVEAANEAMVDAQAAASGLGQTIAVDVAPYVKDLAEQFANAAAEGGSLRTSVGPALEFIVDTTGVIGDTWHLISLGMDGVSLVLITGVGKGLEIAADGVRLLLETLDKIPGVNLKGPISDLKEESAIVQNQIDEQWDKVRANANKPWPSDQVHAWSERVKAEAQAAAEAVAKTRGGGGNPEAIDDEKADAAEKKHADAVQRTMDQLKQQILNVGASKAAILEHRLETEHWTDSEIKNALALEKDIEKLEAMKKAHDEAAAATKHHDEEVAAFAKRVIEESETPAQKLDEQIAKLDEAFASGKLTIEQYAAGVDHARKSLDHAAESAHHLASAAHQLGQYETIFGSPSGKGRSGRSDSGGGGDRHDEEHGARSGSGAGGGSGAAETSSSGGGSESAVVVMLEKIYKFMQANPGVAVWG